MSEINRKIHELHQVDMMSGREGWLSQFHPLSKVLVTVIYILTVVSFDKYDLAGLLPMAVYLFIVMSLHGLTFHTIWKKAGPLFLVVGLVGAVNPFSGFYTAFYGGEDDGDRRNGVLSDIGS